MKKRKASETNSSPNAHRSRSIPVAVLLLLVMLLSAGSGIYAGATFVAQQAPNVTVTTTIFTTTTSWTTSTIWSTVTTVVEGVLTTIEYTTSTSTITVTGTTSSPPNIVTTGGTTGAVGYSANYAAAFPIVMPSSGIVTSIGIKLYGTQSGNVRLALYSAGSSKPANLLTQSASTALSTAGWKDIAVTPCSVSAGTYWVALNFDRNTNVYYSSGSRSYYYKPFGAFAPQWSASSAQDSRYQANMRVTYTAGLGFTVNPSPITQTIIASPLIPVRSSLASSRWQYAWGELPPYRGQEPLPALEVLL